MRIRSPLLTKLAAGFVVAVLKLLFRTLDRDFQATAPETNPYEYDGPERFLYCVWHDELLMPVMAGKHKHTAALVSRHQDGAYLAESMRLLNIIPVRGSTSRGGAEAIRQLMDAARDMHITITPDGPRGPRRQLKPGIVFLASHSGRRIIPTAFAARSEWRIRGSWTDMSVPKPFTQLFSVTGPPITVPPNLSRDELQAWCGRVQAAMEEAQQRAAILVGRDPTAADAPSDVASASTADRHAA